MQIREHFDVYDPFTHHPHKWPNFLTVYSLDTMSRVYIISREGTITNIYIFIKERTSLIYTFTFKPQTNIANNLIIIQPQFKNILRMTIYS